MHVRYGRRSLWNIISSRFICLAYYPFSDETQFRYSAVNTGTIFRIFLSTKCDDIYGLSIKTGQRADPKGFKTNRSL